MLFPVMIIVVVIAEVTLLEGWVGRWFGRIGMEPEPEPDGICSHLALDGAGCRAGFCGRGGRRMVSYFLLMPGPGTWEIVGSWAWLFV